MRFLKYLAIALVVVLAVLGAVTVTLSARFLLRPPLQPLASHVPTPVAVARESTPKPSSAQELYLDLLKKTLTRAQVSPRYERRTLRPYNPAMGRLFERPRKALQARGYELVRLVPSAPENYLGAHYAAQQRLEDAETMVGVRQLDNVQFCVSDVIRSNVPGDLIEAGVWRGGVTILMRGILAAYGDKTRRVWAADSFEGLPKPNRAVETEDWQPGDMAVSVDEVKENFERYGLYDDQVRLLKGYFNRTLPTAPIEKLAVLRADADLYESTMDILNNLYPKLSVGGYAIFDDYQNLSSCRRAVDEYRSRQGIVEPIQKIDSQAVYWQKTR